MKKSFGRTCLLSLLLLLLCAAASASAYETLQIGSKGEAVRTLKSRMYDLGYFTSTNFSDDYNDVTAKRVMNLEEKNGLPQTGVATPELQAFIFSDGCLGADGRAVPLPTPTPAPSPTPAPALVTDLPPRDEKGFVTDGTEYVHIDEASGRWIYLSDTLQVDIRKLDDDENLVSWFETDIKTAQGETMRSLLTPGNPPGRKVMHPETIARSNDAVLAFSDDFFGYRIRNAITPGITVRDGVITSNKTKKTGSSGFPNLETLAYFPDGSMKAFGSSDHTAQEYLDMGALHVLAFGPVLVSGGELTPNMKKDDYYHYREPRCAIGMVEPGHYVLLTVRGRVNNDNGKKLAGVYLPWPANKMLELGVTEAINLDGGGSATLVFMGEMLNKTGTSVRTLTSMMAFGTSAKVPD